MTDDVTPYGRPSGAQPGAPTPVVCLGEVLIDMVPDPGFGAGEGGEGESGLRAARRFVKAAGGAPANVAVAAAKLGVASALIGAVGDDPFGEFLTAELVGNGVDVSAVKRVRQQTAIAFVALGQGGERDFMFYRADAAHDQVSVEQVEQALGARPAAGAAVLHLGSNSLAVEPIAAASGRAVELARSHGTAVSFDVNLRLPFWESASSARAAIERVLPRADLVKLSLDELEFLSGEATRAAAERFAGALLGGGARLVCVTLGAHGAWYFTAASSGAVASPSVASVDTTGAGDAFVAAVLAAHAGAADCWSQPASAREAVGVACAYASLSTTTRGAIPAYRDAAALRRFISEAGISW